MFKLDLHELARVVLNDADMSAERGETQAANDAALVMTVALSRQIREAGGPDGTLEEQLRTLLARPVPIEPGAEMVQALAMAIKEAWKAKATGEGSSVEAARAALSTLAGMGADVENIIANALWREGLSRCGPSFRSRYPDVKSALAADGGVTRAQAENCISGATFVVAAIVPILAAKDDCITELSKAQRSESAALATLRQRLSIAGLPTDPDALSDELERMRDGRERATALLSEVAKERNAAWTHIAELKAQPGTFPDIPAEVSDHAHELGSCSHCDAPQNIGVTNPPPVPPPPPPPVKAPRCSECRMFGPHKLDCSRGRS